jgi:hypothetical protein
MNLHRHQVDAIVDAAPSVTLRGGHRYEWGEAAARAPSVGPGAAGRGRAELARQVALAGAAIRPDTRLDLNADFEAAAGDRKFFRTDLADYQRGKIRGRYRIAKPLSFTASFGILNNQDPAGGVNLDFQSRHSSLAIWFTPDDGKRWSLLVDYTRTTLRSSIPFLAPQDRVREVSRYREDGHYGGASAQINLWREAQVSFGGVVSASSGSRPTRYYQPFARAVVPVHKRVSWSAEWRWYGFGERLFVFENFRSHLFSAGLRIER